MRTYYYFKWDKEAAVFLDLKQLEFETKDEKAFHGIRRYYDTFDWRLYNNNLEFYSEGKNYTLIAKNPESSIQTISFPKRPVFVSDLPAETNLQKILMPILQMRALSQIFLVNVTIKNIRILNKSRKTIARVVSETCNLKNKTVFSLIKVLPLRGYENQAGKLRHWIEDHEIADSNKNLFEILCETTGTTPGSYTSKMNIELHTELSVTEAVKMIHKRLLSVMQQNEDGIINDVDTEFLHDYRVTVRRIRSLYGQAKNVLPQELVKRAKKDYSSLGKLTNRMRDIDVYLLNINKYLDYMPGDLVEYIKPFFENLERERVREHRKLVNNFKSQSYKTLIKYWDSFLYQEDGSDDSKKHIMDFAREKIISRFEAVLSLGYKIIPGSPDVLVHKLRIECKKLRYLLEFYSSLFPSGLIPSLIRQLKILQDYLGEFNDYSIQQATLHEYINTLPLNSEKNKRTITALGFLIGKLSERQMEVRKDFAKTFKKFAGPETTKIFNRIKMADRA